MRYMGGALLELPPEGPGLKVEVYRCGGWHSRASVPQTLLDDGLGGVPL
jgi:hypothetical protein